MIFTISVSYLAIQFARSDTSFMSLFINVM